jgi:hypothetical protein
MDVDIEEVVEEPIETVEEAVQEHKRAQRRSSIHNTQATMRDQSSIGIVGRPSQVGGVELEMEDWEVAPGRMKDDSSESKFIRLHTHEVMTNTSRHCLLQLVPD